MSDEMNGRQKDEVASEVFVDGNADGSDVPNDHTPTPDVTGAPDETAPTNAGAATPSAAVAADAEAELEAPEEYAQGGGPVWDTQPMDVDVTAEIQTKRRGFYMTPRQAFLWMAGLLIVLLVALIGYMIWLSRPADFTKEGGAAEGGLRPVVSIYGPGRNPLPQFLEPLGAAWSPEGDRIYVADTRNNRICVFTSEGRPIAEFGQIGVAKPLTGFSRTWDPGELSYPVDVATGSNGDVYVADFYNDSISVFSEDGEFIRRFPDPYAPTGKGSSGHDGAGIAVTALAVSGDRVYATDTYQVLIFDTEGRLIRQFGRPGLGPTGFDHPGGIAVDRDGRIYVADSNHNRVMAFSEEGEPLWVTGRPVQGLRQRSDNPFVLPRGISIMRDGSLLVADPLGQGLVRLDSGGRVLGAYGARGTAEGQLNFPNDVAVRGEDILIADRQNDRVQVVNLTSR